MLAAVYHGPNDLRLEDVPVRAEQVRRMGADRVISPMVEDLCTATQEESNGRGADVVIVAAPVHAAQENALELAATGGRLHYLGGLSKDRPNITMDSNLIHYKELIITETSACSTADCWQAAQILNSGLLDLSDIVSQRFALREALTAFATAEDRKSLKVVL